MSAPPRPAVVPAERGIYLFKENAEAIVVAYLMALFIRCFFIEVFQIPTGSMEPTLSGNASVEGRVLGGDRIMATKFFPGVRGIERYDVLIFRFPLNHPRVFIKRVVGLPGEELVLLQGNLYARPAGSSGPFLIQRKPLKKQEGIWMPVLQRQGDHPWPDLNLLNDERFPHRWTLHTGDRRVAFSRGRLEVSSLGKDETLEFEPAADVHSDEGAAVDDLLVEAAVTAHGSAGVFGLRVRNIYGTFALELSPDGGGGLTWTPPVGTARHEPLAGATLKPGSAHRVRLMVYDGLCRAEMDGALLAEFTFLEEARPGAEELLKAAERFPALKSPKGWVSSRGLPLTLTDLRLLRDVHYQRRDRADYSNLEEGVDQATAVPPGRYVMMGDNTADSNDNRAWRRHLLKLKDGRTIECEDYELDRSGRDIVVKADIHGNAHVIPRDQLEGRVPAAADGEPLATIGRDDIIGTALWVWWPKGPGGRGVRLIR